jgi:uncharacterized RDD family membrane protein YckC
MLPESSSFFVRGEDQGEYGPVELEELREWIAENRTGIGSEVRRDEPGAPWRPWQNFPELVALLAEVRVTGALASQALAPWSRRALAFAMDLILSGILSFPILFALALIFIPDWCVQSALVSLQQQTGIPPELPTNARIIGSVISDVILACYFAGFHTAHGQTPGKALMHLSVVDQAGKKLPPMRAFLRALVVIISMGLLFVPFLYVFVNPQRRAFHDLVVDSYVIES